MKKIVIGLMILIALLLLIVVNAQAGNGMGYSQPDPEDDPDQPSGEGQESQPTSGTCGDNLYWNLDRTTGLLTITGTGTMWDYGYSAPWYYTQNRNCVQKIIVEEGCTSIGKTAFSQLPNLTSVTLPSTMQVLGEECFLSDRKLTELIMPNVVSIDKYCFKNCIALTEILFPEGLQSIGERCFTNCSALTRVEFPSTLYSVGSIIFAECNALQEVVFAEGFTGEGCEKYAFIGRQRVKTLFHIPDSFCRSDTELFVTDSDRFYATTGSTGALTLGRMGLSFTDPADTHLVRKTHLFDEDGNCNGLRLDEILDNTWTDIEIPSGYTDIACKFGKQVRSAVFPDTVTVVTGNFYDCKALETVVFPDNLTAIPSTAFYLCSSLRDVHLPNALETIGGYAFNGCSSLTSITLPDGLKSIGAQAFRDSGLTAIDIPDGVISIGDYCFKDCYALESTQLPTSLETLGAHAFEDCEKLSSSINIPSGIHSVPDYCFDGCHSLTGIQLPDGLTGIGNSAFKMCWTLNTIHIPDTVKTIGAYAFCGCTGLQAIELPAGITSLSDFVLGGTGIISFNVPETITFMGGHVFESCPNLKEVTIPSSITELPVCTFRGCSVLTDVHLPSNMTSIGNYAFDGCEALKQIDIPRMVTSIGNGAFTNCHSLESIVWPSSVTAIKSTVFMYCWNLRSVMIPETVTVIYENVFSACGKLKNLYLPDGVTWISPDSCYRDMTLYFSKNAEYLIQRCEEQGYPYHLIDTAEEVMSLPDRLTEIEAGAFEGTSAEAYCIPANCTKIGSRAFADLPDGTVITFMGKDAEIAADAFAESKVFFVCPGGGSVLRYIQRMGYPVRVTSD